MVELRAIARNRGLRQKDIADGLGVSEATISKWFQRRATIPTQFIEPLAALLDIKPAEVLSVALPLVHPTRDRAAA